MIMETNPTGAALAIRKNSAELQQKLKEIGLSPLCWTIPENPSEGHLCVFDGHYWVCGDIDYSGGVLMECKTEEEFLELAKECV